MSEIERRVAAGDVGFLPEEDLREFVLARRWFGAKSRDVLQVSPLSVVPLRSAPPLLAAALIEVRFQPGTHEIYQLLLGFRPDGDGWDEAVVGRAEGWTAYDALADPLLASELLHLVRGSSTIGATDGTLDFRTVDGFALPGAELEARLLDGEQSNSSVVFAEELILKVYRRLEAGVNPELELLRFLTEREFPHIAPLVGWYEYAGRLLEATLGVLQRFVPGETDGWTFALESLSDDPEAFLAQARRLGEVTGAMHVALASDASDPHFAPEEPSAEALGLLTATVDEEIEQVFLDLAGDGPVAPIAGRGEEVREQLRHLSHIGAGGRVIRTHGDYHLGQVLWTGEDWIVLDFEGEPARPIPERRRKRSPLRDVAGMLRSFAYAASAASITEGAEPPSDWEARARAEFLAGYVPAAEPSGLLPPGEEAFERLLTVFELEKAIYELRYELDNRPDWVEIPVEGIRRLLETTAPA
ncbi:MAG: phosphotransferase [Gaiellaceae bacterium]